MFDVALVPAPGPALCIAHELSIIQHLLHQHPHLSYPCSSHRIHNVQGWRSGFGDGAMVPSAAVPTRHRHGASSWAVGRDHSSTPLNITVIPYSYYNESPKNWAVLTGRRCGNPLNFTAKFGVPTASTGNPRGHLSKTFGTQWENLWCEDHAYGLAAPRSRRPRRR